MNKEKDTFFMGEALKEANVALSKDEVPIGAVIVCREQIIARSHNLTQCLTDPTAHAEMQAITSACNYLGGKYLTGCTLYVTIEPCPMCAAALAWAQIGQLVYAAADPKRGYSLFCTPERSLLHPKTIVTKGVREDEAASLMKQFFCSKREP